MSLSIRSMIGSAALIAGALTPLAAENLNSQDRTFVLEAAKGGMHEVHAAKMATEKGSQKAVKTFAQRLVNDHTKANDELAALAKKKDVALPAEDPKAMASMPLASKTGADFDREWGTMMVDDHQKTIELFEKEASSGSDPELKAWANKTLPTLRSHLSEAKALPKS